MERIDSLIQRKREIFAAYREKLMKMPGVSMNPEPEGVINGAWMPTVVFSSETCITREKLQSAFADENIDARVFFWPLSNLGIFESSDGNTNSWSISKRAINLPSYHDLSHDDQIAVIRIVEDLYSDNHYEEK